MIESSWQKRILKKKKKGEYSSLGDKSKKTYRGNNAKNTEGQAEEVYLVQKQRGRYWILSRRIGK